MNLLQHLKDRDLQLDRYNGIMLDPSEGVVHFPLWNLSGKLVGYQQYRPEASKERKNDPILGRYYTRLHGDKNEKPLGVWGLESLDYDQHNLVICEGVFDACKLHNLHVPAVALLTSSYKHVRNWLTCLNRKIYKVEDGWGSKLGPYTNIPLPEGRDDLGASPLDDIAVTVLDNSRIFNMKLIEYSIARDIRTEIDKQLIEEIKRLANEG